MAVATSLQQPHLHSWSDSCSPTGSQSLWDEHGRDLAHGHRASRDGDARGVLHHGALALQVVLVDGALLLLLLLLQTVLVIAALIWVAVLPVTRVAHHTWKTNKPY